MISFTYEPLGSKVLFLPGSLAGALAGEVRALGCERILLVSTVAESDLAQEVTQEVAKLVKAHFKNVKQHVPVEVADEARKAATSSKADVVVCVGGGSTVGTAKAIALTSGLPIIAVPTTYAGSEMTPVWGMTEDGEKVTGTSRRVLPRVVLYEPALTATLPYGITVTSACNALAHCVEAFWAPGRNPITSLIAKEGIAALRDGLLDYGANEESTTARATLLYGAYLGGSAFAVAGSGLHHKICHVLGGAFNLPHSETHTVVLPYVLAFNARGGESYSREIANAFGVNDSVEGLVDLYRHLKVARSLSELGLGESDLAVAVDLVAEKLPVDNPYPVDKADVLRILKDAFEGTSPLDN